MDYIITDRSARLPEPDRWGNVWDDMRIIHHQDLVEAESVSAAIQKWCERFSDFEIQCYERSTCDIIGNRFTVHTAEGPQGSFDFRSKGVEAVYEEYDSDVVTLVTVIEPLVPGI